MKAVNTALYSRLHGDATLLALLGSADGIYRHVAPATAVCPFVTFQQQTGEYEYVQSGHTCRGLTYLVQAIDVATVAPLSRADDIDARIDALLTDYALAVTGWKLLYLRRQSDVEYVEVVDGAIYQHVGGLYRIELEEA